MNKEVLHKTIKCIEEYGFSEWNSIVEIANKKEEIKDVWFGKVRSQLIKYFNNNLSENWEHKDCKVWYLKGNTDSSLGVWFEDFHIVSLWSSSVLYDNQKAKELLQKKEFAIISDKFERIDKRFDGDYKIREYGNFKFDTPIDGHYDSDTISFFAGLETDRFCKQVIEKIERFTNNHEVTELFKQINELTKK